jgi:hypothetical protein
MTVVTALLALLIALIIVILALRKYYTARHQTSQANGAAFIRDYAFPRALRTRVEEHYPALNAAQISAILDG